ncbi:MAG: DUF47 domain-containing protein [Candidatus Limnocylindrales bacterium]
MSYSLLKVLRDLGGGSNRVFEQLLVGHLDATIAGARLARDVVSGITSREDAREKIIAIEHEGDALRAELLADLSRALVTPIDREDLFRISRLVDDVLDNLRDFLREWDLFEMTVEPALVPLLEAVILALGSLRDAVRSIVDEPSQIGQRASVSKRAGAQIRRLYELELAALYRSGEATVGLLKVRDLIRRLDVVGLRIGEAGDALADAAVKRSI